jgi:hypothetical protein
MTPFGRLAIKLAGGRADALKNETTYRPSV